MKWAFVLLIAMGAAVCASMLVNVFVGDPRPADPVTGRPMVVVEVKLTPEERLRAGAERLFDALQTADYEGASELLYPPYASALGGRDAAARQLQAIVEVGRKRGKERQGFVLGEIGAPVQAGSEIHAVVKYKELVKEVGGVHSEDRFLIAVSDDKGESWSYVMSGILAQDRLRTLFPEYNDDLELPAPAKLPEVVEVSAAAPPEQPKPPQAFRR